LCLFPGTGHFPASGFSVPVSIVSVFFFHGLSLVKFIPIYRGEAQLAVRKTTRTLPPELHFTYSGLSMLHAYGVLQSLKFLYLFTLQIFVSQ
jgi:hypothetical protein